MTDTMHAVILERFGGPEGLVDAMLPIPPMSAQDVLIRVKAVAFNPTDYQLRKSGHPDLTPPIVLGRDVAGIIEACGAEVTGFRPSDAVYSYLAARSAGGYAAFAAIPHWFVAPKPAALDFLTAASVPVVAITALHGLKRARPEPAKSLLVTGGAGGVGSWVILLARAFGVTRIVTTAGSPASRAYLRDALGIADARILDYSGRGRSELAAAAIAANDGQRFDIAFDCVGAAMTHLCCDAVEFEGDVVSVVNGPRDETHPRPEANEDDMFDRSAAFHFEMASALAYYAPPIRHKIYGERLREIAALIDSGRVQPPPVTNLGRLSAAVVREAHRRLEGGHTIGKLAATVD